MAMMTTTDDERDTQSDDNSSDDLSGKVTELQIIFKSKG
jgi:hypothetical protein